MPGVFSPEQEARLLSLVHTDPFLSIDMGANFFSCYGRYLRVHKIRFRQPSRKRRQPQYRARRIPRWIFTWIEGYVSLILGTIGQGSDASTVGTTPAVLGYGALAAVVLGAFDYTGGALTGYRKDPNVDEFDRKEYLRKNRRRPIEQTIEELGEGRGMLICVCH